MTGPFTTRPLVIRSKARTIVSALACILTTCGIVALTPPTASALATSPQILVLFSDDPSQSWVHEITEGLSRVGDERSGNAPAWYFEYLDAVRFQNAERDGQFRAAIGDKYRTRRLDLIVAVASNAIAFIAAARDQLWPDVPVLAAEYGAGGAALRIASVPNVSTLSFEYGLTPSLATIKRVFPDAAHLVISSGISAAERARESELVDDVRRAGFDYAELNAATLAEMRERVAHLPDRTLLFLAGGQMDADGTAIPTWRMCETLSTAANRPAIMLGSQFVGCGIVGGLMRDYAKIGTIIGERAVAAASAPRRDNEVVPFSAIATLKFDARQLARWAVDEDRLPPSSIVAFRRPSIWRDYRRDVLILAGAIAAESILIGTLIYERRRRRHAELDSRRSLALAAEAHRRGACRR
jgi:ABC-type uncharacterized transport system substrate-binding protein